MDLRHSRIRKDGKTHTYWRRVRSVRRQGKVVQESVRPREQRVATHQRHVHRLHAIAGTHTARPRGRRCSLAAVMRHGWRLRLDAS